MVFCPCLLQGVSLQCCYLFIYFYMRLYVIFWFSSLFCTNRRLADISSELIHLGESRLFCPRNVPCFLKEICVSDQRPEGTLKHLPTPGWMSKKNFGWMKMAFNVQQLKSEPSQWARQHWHVPSQLHIFASEDLESLTCASKRPWKKTRKVPRCCSRPVWGVDSTQQFAAWVVLMLASRCCMSGNASSAFFQFPKESFNRKKKSSRRGFCDVDASSRTVFLAVEALLYVELVERAPCLWSSDSPFAFWISSACAMSFEGGWVAT